MTYDYVQYGCGPVAPEGWMNFDASLTLRLQKVPFLKKFMGRKAIFPETVKFGDIIRGLPVSDGSVSGLYCSHVLEHIHRDQVEVALRNSIRVLKSGGIFRLVVPDLSWRIEEYLAQKGRSDAAELLQKRLNFRKREAPQGIEGRMRAAFGLSMHQWMYDEALMSELLQNAGFTEIRRCALGDCEDEMFSKVEEESRFIAQGFRELAIECRKK